MSGAEKKRAVVAMSGGVDSSVAAHLLLREGWAVSGVFMRRAAGTGSGRPNSDERDARDVARMLNIEIEVVDFAAEFKSLIGYFLDEYNRGRTPNPCAVCNRTIKFGALLRLARERGADCFATGHHARIERNATGEYFLKKGRDPVKDQSYMLFNIERENLPFIRFPLGGTTKERVRAIADEIGLPVRHKPDSQDICFVPGGDYRALFMGTAPGLNSPGDIVDESGIILGRHDGHQFYTVGQRRGLGIAAGVPIYVVGLDSRKNEVIVGPAESLMRDAMCLEGVNWLKEPKFDSDGRAEVSASIRYAHKSQPARLEKSGQKWLLTFERKVRAATPGQAAVFYDGDTVLGGGWISETFCT